MQIYFGMLLWAFKALWRACELQVEHNSKEHRHSHALLSKEHITSLSDLAGITHSCWFYCSYECMLSSQKWHQ